jgi:hypothetical protein
MTMRSDAVNRACFVALAAGALMARARVQEASKPVPGLERVGHIIVI